MTTNPNFKFCKRQYSVQTNINKKLDKIDYFTLSGDLIKYGQEKVSEGGVSMQGAWEVSLDLEEAAFSKEQGVGGQKKFDIMSDIASSGSNTEQSMIVKIYYRLGLGSGSGEASAFDRFFSPDPESFSHEKREVMRLASRVRFLYRFNIDMLILACRVFSVGNEGEEMKNLILEVIGQNNEKMLEKYIKIVGSYN